MVVNKLQRFEEVASFDHVLEYTDFQHKHSQKAAGRWNSDIFENDNPIILELACGKGTYTTALAKRFTDKNFVGIDIKGARIWKGANRAKQEGLDNVRFMRMYIDHLDEYFSADEIDDIWITFPDPYPRFGDRNKRLTSPKFINIYKNILKDHGSVRLKTDSQELLSYTKRIIKQESCKVVQSISDIYQKYPEDELLTIQTDFEMKHLTEGRTISFLEFRLG